MGADEFFLLYTYNCQLIFSDDDLKLMDIKRNDFIDCYSLFFAMTSLALYITLVSLIFAADNIFLFRTYCSTFIEPPEG